MDDNAEIANEYINLWQENFEKMLSSDVNMRQMQQMLSKMQGFYGERKDESTTAANRDAHGAGNADENIRALERKVDELTARVADLEKSCS